MPTDTIIDSQPFYLWDTACWTPEVTEVNVGVPLDSVFRAVDQPAPQVRRSLFVGHTLEPQHDGLVARQPVAAPAWFFFVLLVLGASIFFYFSSRKIKMRDLLASTIDHRAIDRLVRGSNLNPLRLMSIGVLVSAMVALVVCYVADWNFPFWCLLSLGLSLAYMFRWGLLRLIGRIFDDENAMSTYIIGSYLYHLVLALALLPLTLLIIYMPWGTTALLLTAVALTALCFLMRLFRGVKLFLTISKAPNFYLFYYLCTVELIPVLILLKVFIVQ